MDTSRIRSPLERFRFGEPRVSAETARARQDAASRQIIRRWKISLASAIERLELQTNATL